MIQKDMKEVTDRLHPYWFLNSRKERLTKYPLRTLKNALERRIMYFLLNNNLLGANTTITSFWGKKFSIPTQYSYAFKKGFIEGEELRLTKFIVDTLRPGQTFIDGGANFGWYSMIAEELGAKVHSFEPAERIYENLKKNVGKNVHLVKKALWNTTGVMEFHDFGPRLDASNTILTDKNRVDFYDVLFTNNKDYRKSLVETITLDEYCIDVRPDFIKLDCEGAELEILQGATEVLKHSPIVVCEMFASQIENGNGKVLLNLMSSFGYKPYTIGDDFKLHPFTKNFNLANIVFVK